MGVMGSLVGLQLVVLFLSVVLLPSPSRSTEVERKPLQEHPVAPPHPAPPPMIAHHPLLPPPVYVAAEGVIYCRCKLPGYLKAVDGAPLLGAVVLLKCINGRRGVCVAKGNTDDRGYFYLQTQLISKYLARRCKVFVLWSPVRSCPVPRQYGLKGTGGSLMFQKKVVEGSTTKVFYSAGFFEFGPPTSSKCYLR